MRKRLVGLALGFGIVGVLTLGCGGNNMSPQQPAGGGAMGSVAILAGDSPLCDVVSFTVTISSASLTPEGGGAAVAVINSSSPVTVDFAALMDFFTMLNLASVPVGTYNQLSLTLSNPQITILDTTQNPPKPVTSTPTLTSLNVTINLDPPLQVTATGAVALNIDFKLRKSVSVDAKGNVTVNPVFRASTQTTPDHEDHNKLEDDEDLHGLVQTVNTTPTAGTSFTGSFTVQTESGSTSTVEVTADTQFEGVSGLSALTPMTFVEVDAFVDENGNIVAKKVGVEEQEDAERAAFVGVITAATRDSSSNVTSFTLFVRGEHPDESSCVPPHSNLTVNVNSETEYKIGAEGVNRAGLAFNASALGVGQRVVVHGVCQPAAPPPAPAGPPTVTAASVFLRLQTLLGSFVPPPAPFSAASDDKTGGFTLNPCSSIFGGQPITVFTFAETAFADVNGLNELTPTPELATKGLLFYVTQAPVTVNNLTVTPPPPMPVFSAKAVHQLD